MTHTIKPSRSTLPLVAAMVLLAAAMATSVHAADAGRVKVSRGSTYIERHGAKLPAPVGALILTDDTVVTGADGSIGIAFLDNSLLSTGPNSVLTIDKFVFDTTTHDGAFETTLKKGTLAAISGQIVKRTPEAMKVRTPAAVMGVRGTEFVVQVAETGN